MNKLAALVTKAENAVRAHPRASVIVALAVVVIVFLIA